MRRRVSVPVLALTAVAVVSTAFPAVAVDSDPAPAEPFGRRQTNAQAAVGIIVQSTSSSAAKRESLAATAEPALPDDAEVAATVAGKDGLSLLSLDNAVESADLDDAIARIEARPDVEYAIPNGLRYATTAPPVTSNDPDLAKQHHVWDSSVARPDGGYSTRVAQAWHDGVTGSSAATVAVLDTGIRADHPDLAGQVRQGADLIDQDCRWAADNNCYYTGSYTSAGDNNGRDTNPEDVGDYRTTGIAAQCASLTGSTYNARSSSWHGTHVAGIVAAARDNTVGGTGIAPGVKVQSVRVLGRCDGTDWDIYDGILWAAGYSVGGYSPVNPTPAKVINLSLGGAVPSNYVSSYCAYYGAAAAKANAKGALVVAAAGNDSDTTIANHRYNMPSACPGFVAVAAVSPAGRRAWYSTAGANVDIAAQGGDMNVPDGPGSEGNEANGIYSTLNTGTQGPVALSYAYYQGTSMATPAVAAGAALLYSLGMTNPAFVERALKATAQPFPTPSASYNSKQIKVGTSTFTTANLNCSTSLCGAGILNLENIASVPLPLSNPKITGSAVPGRTLSVSTGSWRNAGSYSYAWYRGSTLVSTSATYKVAPADLGQRLSARVRAVGGNQGIYADAALSVAKAKSSAKFSMPSKVKKSKKAKLKVTVSAPYVRATGTIRVYDGKRKIATKKLTAGAKGRVTITLPKLKKGTHRIKVVYSGNAQLTAATSKVRKVTSR